MKYRPLGESSCVCILQLCVAFLWAKTSIQIASLSLLFIFLEQGTRRSFQYHTIRLPGRFQVSPLGEKKANHIPLWIFSNPFNMLIFIMNLQQVGIEFATVPKLISLQNLSFHGFPQDQHPTKYTLEKSVWKAVLCLCTTALSTNSL